MVCQHSPTASVQQSETQMMVSSIDYISRRRGVIFPELTMPAAVILHSFSMLCLEEQQCAQIAWCLSSYMLPSIMTEPRAKERGCCNALAHTGE